MPVLPFRFLLDCCRGLRCAASYRQGGSLCAFQEVRLNEDIYQFLIGRAWRKKRKEILKRDGYICQYFKKQGKIVPATVVHHILPIEDFPQYVLEDWNLISLSKAAHNKIEKGMAEDGLRMLRETAMKRGIEIPEKYV